MKAAQIPHIKVDLAPQQLDAERWLDEGGGFRAEAVPSAQTDELENAFATQPAGQYHCLCRNVFQVFGRGRHRRYYELADLGWRHPLMARACPSCERPLPGKN